MESPEALESEKFPGAVLTDSIDHFPASDQHCPLRQTNRGGCRQIWMKHRSAIRINPPSWQNNGWWLHNSKHPSSQVSFLELGHRIKVQLIWACAWVLTSGVVQCRACTVRVQSLRHAYRAPIGCPSSSHLPRLPLFHSWFLRPSPSLPSVQQSEARSWEGVYRSSRDEAGELSAACSCLSGLTIHRERDGSITRATTNHRAS